MKRVRNMWWMALAFPASLAIGLMCLNTFASPAHKGVTDGKLGALPDSPNCVSTQTVDPEKRMDPIPVFADSKDAIEAVAEAVGKISGSLIVKQTDNYLHAEFRSAICRFVDDVEFYVDEHESLLHFRSASRVGYSDLGVNRERMKEIRALLIPKFQAEPAALQSSVMGDK